MEFDAKAAAMEVMEDTAKSLISKVIRPFAESYIQNSENKIDDIILPFMAELEKHLLVAADKIDGKEG